MHIWKLSAVGLVAWATVAYVADISPSAQEPSAQQEFKPPPPPAQPIPYSHKTHLAQGLKCAQCHESAETDDEATLPATPMCMRCHATIKIESPHIQQLKDWQDKNEIVPWRRVYRLPSFVDFSHKQHVTDAKVTCDVCHGNVPQMDQMQKVKDISMGACIECHTARSAPANCNTCHEPQ
jgi:hypothetical protein